MGGKEAQQGGTRAFEARDTQPGSKSDEGYVYKRNKAAEKVGQSINDQGNKHALKRTEPGRDDKAAKKRGAGRESAPSTARVSTGVAPSDPIDPESPHIQTP